MTVYDASLILEYAILPQHKRSLLLYFIYKQLNIVSIYIQKMMALIDGIDPYSYPV